MDGSIARPRARWWLALQGAVAGAGLAAACTAPAPVVQGRIISIDAQTITMQDEERPDGVPLVIDISSAEVGGRSAAGDIIRVVYRTEGTTNRALALMNVSQERRADAGSR